MERLTTGTVLDRPRLELRAAEPVEPARKDRQGDKPAEAASLKKEDSARLDLRDLAEQVAAIEKMRSDVSALKSNRLRIDRHEESGQFIYRIFNEDTGETIRRWPPEGYLDLVAFLKDEQGKLVDERA